MKGTVINWLSDTLEKVVLNSAEMVFRLFLLCVPLGVFLFVIQNRKDISKVSNLSVYTNDTSTWQHVFPGFILVAINPKLLENFLNRTNRDFQLWVQSNRYTLSFLAAVVIVIVMVLAYIKIY